MKKFIPFIISILLFITSIILFYQPLYQVIANNNTLLIALITIFTTGILSTIFFFIMFTRTQKRRNAKLRERLKMWTDLSDRKSVV